MVLHVKEGVSLIADRFALSEDERNVLIPSGRGVTLIQNRTHWAKTYLAKAGLLETTRRGWFRITPRGKAVLAETPPVAVNTRYLRQFPEFLGFLNSRRSSGDAPADEVVAPEIATKSLDPLRADFKRIETELRGDILERIMTSPADFFERLIGRLAVAMGYGGGRVEAVRVVGRSGDRGVDVEVDEDALGVNQILLQAKRYSTGQSVGAAEVRDFAGALALRKATRGVIATTSRFAVGAKDAAERLGIVLIDGDQLAALMIRYDVGVRIEETFHIKKIDEDFFIE
jgi:restriction system protein